MAVHTICSKVNISKCLWVLLAATVLSYIYFTQSLHVSHALMVHQTVDSLTGHIQNTYGTVSQSNQDTDGLYVPDFASSSNSDEVDLLEYFGVLTKHADQDKIIVLAMTDSASIDMALNFHQTSLVKFNITNYLFISLDVEACEKLKFIQIQCFVYMTDENAHNATGFGSKIFNRKMNVRTFMISDALPMGFTVLHTDTDIYFFRNPLEDINCTVGCDLVALWDAKELNAGFLYIRPTETSIAVYQDMANTALTTAKTDQAALNMAVERINETLPDHDIGVAALPEEKYMCGSKFFHMLSYLFPDKLCSECVVVHNNFIKSLAAKRYRFREFQMWMYDENGYYSDPSRKYLIYDTPTELDDKIQLASLKTALYFGDVLNRTVILPRFHCSTRHYCLLYKMILMPKFDKFFDGKYRESSFLSHPMVPDKVRSPDSGVDTVYWVTNGTQHDQNGGKTNIELQYTGNKGPSRAEIFEMFGKMESPVLHIGTFKYLYGDASIPEEERLFADVLSQAI